MYSRIKQINVGAPSVLFQRFQSAAQKTKQNSGKIIRMIIIIIKQLN